jgi:UDP-N-acetylmuramoylalanine--D-glutamate ligase
MADQPSSSESGFAGRTVLVCGARFAGLAATRALVGRGARVVLSDRVEPAATLPAGVDLVPELSEIPAGIDLVVTSPGWRPSHPVFASAAEQGLDVIGEVELAWRLRGPDAPPWLAVTGTNGKTTTVRMLESILLRAGRSAIAVGNVGVSIIDAVLAGNAYDVLAVELSSFQLYWSSSVRPLAGAILNLAPDHLDWHESMADYGAAKARIWAAEVAIANHDDESVMALFERAPASARLVEFTLAAPAAGQFGVLDGVLVRSNSDGRTHPLLPAGEVRPGGSHNVANALAASALADAYGIGPEAIAAGLRAFVPDPHRNQFVASVAGVDYVDDSKATNPHAAAASLSAYPRIVWIAGGQLKGAPIEDLVEQIAPRLSGVVLLGADREQISAALSRHAPDVPVIEVTLTDDRAMSEVVRTAAVLARAGDTVVLAPAAASYDMFAGYAQRGLAFVAAVNELTGSGESGRR